MRPQRRAFEAIAATRRTAECAPREALARHGERKALRAANDNNITSGLCTRTKFAYDGLGRRLKQTVGATETRYLWCGAAICQQRSNTDVVQKRFFAEGEYVLTGTKKYLTLTDHLGSVRDLVDITGTPTLVGSFDYTPYGAVARTWGTVTPGYTYAGLFAHTQTGLLLSATRAYEPTKGRFLNRDMIPDWGYGYGNASPMLFIDPMGLSPNPLELTCIYPGQPLCWAGIAADVATNLWLIYRVGRFIQATMPPAIVHNDSEITDQGQPVGECPKPEDLTGKTPEEVDDLMTGKGWIKSSTGSGGGNRYQNPKKKGEQVRWQPGFPTADDPIKRGPYFKISTGGPTGGQVSKPIPGAGNPMLPK